MIRLAVKDDTNFILDAWIKTIHNTYPNQFDINFIDNSKPTISHLFNKSVCLVYALPEDKQEILGFVVYTSFRNNLIVHFAYTKADARKQNILNELLITANPLQATIVFTTPAKNENIMAHLSAKYLFDPSIRYFL